MRKKKAEEMFENFMENHDVEDSAAVQQSYEKVLNYFCILTGKDKAEIEDVLSYAGYEREKQGFINGFGCAMQKVFDGEVAAVVMAD